MQIPRVSEIGRPPVPRRSELRTTAALGMMRVTLRAAAAAGDPGSRVLCEPPIPDPYPEYERIRARGPAYRNRLGSHFTASHHACSAVLRDANWQVMPAEEVTPARWDAQIAHPLEHSLLAMNPPEHTRLRRVVAPWFTPRALRGRQQLVERTVHGFLDELAERERFDLIGEFATRVPIKVICDLLAVDDARHADFARWGEIIGGAIDGVRTLAQWRAVDVAAREMTAYFTDLVERRRAEPGDDVVSGLVARSADFAPRDLVATAALLLGAGFETTRNLIGNGVLALLRNPDQLQLLRTEPERAENAVEEVLRYDSPVQQTARLPATDTSVDGHAVRRGELLGVLLGGANRDPEVFDEPDRFDIARDNAREHLSFSGGVHYCLGAGLARIEGEVALRELVTRFPNLAGAGDAWRRRNRVLRGLTSLPVSTGARAAVPA